MKHMKKAIVVATAIGFLAFGAAACSTGAAKATTPTYSPQHEQYSIVAVPLLVHEQTGFFDYLQKAFAKHGLLDGKEVWGWSQSHITVYEGDQVTADLLNPGDDPHTFTITELAVNTTLDPGAKTSVSFYADKVGTFKFFCSVPEHQPYMSGTITVLPDSAAQ